jgi:GNAT superfamily N-acetyltransferase
MIRTADPDDAFAIAAIWRESLPFLVKTAAGIAYELRTSRSRQVLVATDGGEVVGYGSLWLLEAPGDACRINVLVPPAARKRGTGTALLERVVALATEAGAGDLLATVTPDARDFAVRRGFVIGRELSHSSADLADLPEPAPVPDGLRATDFTEVEPGQVWEASRAVSGDDPSGLSGILPYDEWLAVEWQHPDHALDLSVALLDGDTVASFVSTTADTDRGVVWSNLTGTRPEYRGRGLAKVVKSHALARCRDAGITTALTGNDANNHAMLAVNAWLGYRVAGTQWTAVRAHGSKR